MLAHSAQCTKDWRLHPPTVHFSQMLWSKIATVLAHGVMGSLLLLRARKTDLQQSKSIYSCYMFVWKLFYAEYLFIPLLR